MVGLPMLCQTAALKAAKASRNFRFRLWVCNLKAYKGGKVRNSIALPFAFRLFSIFAPQRGPSSASLLPDPYEANSRISQAVLKLGVCLPEAKFDG
jgi:hypothetical protein